jgi:hypothetical protein
MKTVAIAIGLLLLPSLAFAEVPAPVCATTDTALPAEWSGWTTPKPAGVLTPGGAYMLSLNPSEAMTYVVPLGRPPAPDSFAAIVPLDITKAGTYSIGLDQGAWIDVAKEGTALVSTGHGHGPTCSSIRKYVDFALTPGHYNLQISNAKAQTARVMIIAKP